MNKSNLFFVESPLQLISATKARDHFNILNAVIYINVKKKGGKNHQQLINELDDKWEKIHFLYDRGRYHHYFQFFLMLFKLRLKYKGNVENFFYGEYRNTNFAIYESLLSPNESILLDDGSVTITVQKDYIQTKQSMIPIKGFKRTLFKQILSKKRRVPHLFSFFDLNQYLLPEQKNYYPVEKENRSTSISNDIYFIGSKLSEADYIDECDELKVLEAVIKEYSSSDLYYIPHRGESTEKISKIEDLGYIIKRLKKPLESFYETTNVMPKELVSYYSTALYTCYLTFGSQVKLTAIDVRKYLTTKIAMKNVDTIYDYYSDIGIETKSLK